MPEISLKMKFIRLESKDPYYNLAVEEYLFENSTEDIFMLWQNDKTVVIGKNQNAYAEVNLEFAKSNNIRISRRITGGGAVYHDLGNVNYSFITSSDKAIALDYKYFTEPIIKALSTFGINCQLSGRNDIEYNGRKFSGNAQHTKNSRILHHGTLLFDVDIYTMSNVLRVNKEKLEYKSVKSHSARVTNLRELLGQGIDVNTFINNVEDFVCDYYRAQAAMPPSNDLISEICARNISDEWIYSNKRYLTNYKTFKQKKYSFGVVKLDVNWNKDIIEDIVISGDFFGSAPIEILENKIKGKSIKDISDIEVSNYIDKMTSDEFLALLSSES